MAGNIKGVTIEFRGDTTKLDKALRQIKNSTKDIDRELKNVDKALKFNPTSVELWKQKQTLLEQKIKQTKKNLEELKSAQAQMDAQGVDKSSEAYQRVRREIIETESKLKTFNGQLKQVGNVSLKAASEQVRQVGQSLESAGQQMQGLSMAAAAVVASLGLISYKAGENADELNTLSKVYSIGTGDLQKYKATADLVDVSVETIAKSHTKLEKSMYSAQDGSGSMAEAFDKLGVSVTDADGNLRDSDEVWQDTIAALGQVENETERDALAMQLMGKSAAELNPLIEDGGETYKNVAETMEKYGLDFVDQETLDKANEFNDELDTMKMIGSVAIAQVGSQLAAFLVPALEKVVDWIGKLANWLSTLSPEVLTIIGIVAGVVAAIAPVLMILGKLAMAVSSIMNLANLLGVSIAGLASPIGIAIAAVVAIIAIGVLLYKNWDTIKAKALALWNALKTTFNNIKTSIITAWTNIKTKVTSLVNGIKTGIATAWNAVKTKVTSVVNSVKSKVTSTFNALKSTVTTIWNGIKQAITHPIETAKTLVQNAINRIKSFFPFHVGRIMSGLKLPHFKITGKFSLNPPSTPHIGVDWYARGGIFDGPSVIGVGEKGPEAVVPLDKFWDKLDNMSGGETNITININGSNKDPKEIAEEVKRVLIQETNRRRLAWQ